MNLKKIVATITQRLKPSHLRNWEHGQEIISEIIWKKNTISFRNVRNFSWIKDEYLTPSRYLDASFSTSDIIDIYFGTSYFSKYKAIAHTFFYIKTKKGNFVISYESRREIGESFSPFLGAFRTYELIGIIATDDDFLHLRKEIRKEKVVLEKIHLSNIEKKNLLKEITLKINTIYNKPSFYNTFFENCTTILAEHLSKATHKNVYSLSQHFAPGFFSKSLKKSKLL